MAIERWKPFSWGLRRWLPTRWPEEEMEDMFDRFERMFGVPAPRRAIVETRGWGPLVEMFDRKDEVLLRADLPGVKKEDIRVSVTGDVLSIEGERNKPSLFISDTAPRGGVRKRRRGCCTGSYGCVMKRR